MRSSDEQFQEILKRADRLREVQTERKAAAVWAVSAAACLVLLIVSACFLPAFQAENHGSVSSRFGSLLLGSSYTGYVVIGILAFLLGVCGTLLAIHIRKLREKERDRQ